MKWIKFNFLIEFEYHYEKSTIRSICHFVLRDVLNISDSQGLRSPPLYDWIIIIGYRRWVLHGNTFIYIYTCIYVCQYNWNHGLFWIWKFFNIVFLFFGTSFPCNMPTQARSPFKHFPTQATLKRSFAMHTLYMILEITPIIKDHITLWTLVLFFYFLLLFCV